MKQQFRALKQATLSALTKSSENKLEGRQKCFRLPIQSVWTLKPTPKMKIFRSTKNQHITSDNIGAKRPNIMESSNKKKCLLKNNLLERLLC